MASLRSSLPGVPDGSRRRTAGTAVWHGGLRLQEAGARLGPALRWTAAVLLAVVAAVGSALVADGELVGLQLLAVALAVTWLGVRCAVLTAVLVGLLTLVVLDPVGQVTWGPEQRRQLAVFVPVAAVVILLGALARQAVARADRTARTFDALLEAAPVGMGILDDRMRFVTVNPALARINQLPADAHLGKRIEEALPSISPVALESIRSILAGGPPLLDVEIDDPETRPGLRQVAVSVSWFPLRDAEGAVSGVGATLLDITAQRLPKRRLQLLAALSAVFASEPDSQARLDHLVRLLVPSMADLALVMLPGAKGLELSAWASSSEELADGVRASLTAQPDPAATAGSLAAAMLSDRAMVNDDYDPSVDAGSPEHLAVLQGLGIRRSITVPISVGRGERGILAMGRVGAAARYDEDERAFVEEIASRAAAAIESARLYEQLAATAAALQTSLLPAALPSVPGAEVATLFVPAGDGMRVGGDTYDVFAATDGWIIGVADVCGQGARAASVASLFRHVLRAEAFHDPAPADLLGRVNAVLCRELPEQQVPFVTAAVAHLCPEDDGFRVRLASGGHPPPVVVSADGARFVETRGSLLGVFPDAPLAETELVLGPGDVLLLYTDGVTEAHSAGRPLFGDQLLSVVGSAPDRSPAALLRAIEAAVRAHVDGQLDDDVAALALRVGG